MALLALASITLVTLDARGNGILGGVRRDARAVLDPISSATHGALAPVGNFLTGAVNYGALKSENQRLRTEIAGMQSQAAVNQAAGSMASQIIAQAGLPWAANLHGVTAAVSNRTPSNYDVTVQINKGTADGVAVGYPVVTAAGLVGQVTTASAHRSTVLVLTDPAFTVGVDIGGQQAVPATGAGPANPLTVGPLTAGNLIGKGTIVLTSGLDLETFPPGIPVGKVTSVSTPTGSSQETVRLAPLVNPARLQVVTVLVYSPQTPATPTTTSPSTSRSGSTGPGA